ncbi:MAG TPA: YegP family protein [Flavipsychrobacter sp.]
MATFYLRTATNGEYYFNLKAGNGETILTSERYASKQGARNGIDSVKENAPYDSRYEKRTATNGEYYFVLKASNGQVIGVSERYVTSSGRDGGIDAVKRNAPSANIVE